MKFNGPAECKSDTHLAPEIKERSGLDQNDTDDEFWSLFNDTAETETCKAKSSSLGLDEIEDYDTQEPENFDENSLDMYLGNRYSFQSDSSIYQQRQATSNRSQTVSKPKDDTLRSSLQSRPPRLSLQCSGESCSSVAIENSSSALREPPVISKKVPPFINGRKRIIDEILDLDGGYDCASVSNKKVSKLNSESSRSTSRWRNDGNFNSVAY